MGVTAGQPEGHRMDQIHVALNQFSESWFRAAVDVLFQEFSAFAHRLYISKDPLNRQTGQESLEKMNHEIPEIHERGRGRTDLFVSFACFVVNTTCCCLSLSRGYPGLR